MTAPKVFSEGDLADFLIDRWQSFSRELQTTHPERIGELRDRYVLNVPKFGEGLHIVERGFVSPGRPESEFEMPKPRRNDYCHPVEFVRAKISYLEALLRHTTPRVYTIFSMPIEGDAELLRYRPSAWPVRFCPAFLGEHSLCVRVERSGKEDTEWKTILVEAASCVLEAMEHIPKEIEPFNAVIAAATSSITASPAPAMSAASAT